MAIRLCLSVPIKPEYKRVNGRFQISGVASDDVKKALFLWNNFNLTHVRFPIDSKECIELMSRNETDLAPIYVAQEKHGLNWQVPVPVFARKFYIVSGYSVKRLLQEREIRKTTAVTNFSTFDPLSYIITCLLFASLIFILIANYRMRFRWKRKRSLCGNFLALLMRKYGKMNEKAPFVQWLISLLAFWAMVHFSILYKTEQVITYKPEVIDSYEKLLSIPHAMPIFFDGFYADSREFRLAQPDSPRGQIWQRLVSSGKDYKKFVVKGVNQSALFQFTGKKGMLFNLTYSLIGSTQASHMVARIFCGVSDEGNLWQTVLNADPSEQEDLVGWTVRNSIEPFSRVKRFIRQLVESGMLIEFFKNINYDIMFDFSKFLVSRDHFYKQKHICLGLEKAYSDTNDAWNDLGFDYYLSFFKVLFSLFGSSAFTLFLECLAHLI